MTGMFEEVEGSQRRCISFEEGDRNVRKMKQKTGRKNVLRTKDRVKNVHRHFRISEFSSHPILTVRCFQRPNRSFICFCFVRFHFFFVRAQFPVHDFSANLPTSLLQIFSQPPASPKLPVKVHVLCTASMKTTNEFTRFSVQSVRRLQPP